MKCKIEFTEHLDDQTMKYVSLDTINIYYVVIEQTVGKYEEFKHDVKLQPNKKNRHFL